MNTKDGVFRQRVGALIEKDVCKKFDLFYNKRQHTQGYYDAYNKDNLYEIKASNLSYNTFIIRLKNHNLLLNNDGSYIFVSYSLKNKDVDLRVISDIIIQDIHIISGLNMDGILKRHGNIVKKNVNKDYIRIKIRLNHVLGAKGIKKGV